MELSVQLILSKLDEKQNAGLPTKSDNLLRLFNPIQFLFKRTEENKNSSFSSVSSNDLTIVKEHHDGDAT
jgi:hypothetical protein